MQLPMHPHVILNQRLLKATSARLHAVTAATLYGRGVFTTVAVHKGRPFLWDAHWSRLLAHAERAGVECDFGDDETALMLARLIEANEVERGRARVHLLARTVRGRWRFEGGGAGASDLLVMTAGARVTGLAEELAVPTVEGAHTLHELGEAEEIFLTSSSLGVAPVAAFDYHRYAVPVGSVALRLREAFRQLTLHAD